MGRPRRILAIAAAALVVAAAAPAAAKGPLGAGKAQAIRAFVKVAMDQLHIPGVAVVIVDASGIVFGAGFGSARDDGTPVTPQTPFQIASLSKELTAIAVMQLVASGDLRVDETVHHYIDWFGADGSGTARITVGNLLAHTSGWSAEQGLTNRLDESRDDGTLERNVRRLAAEPLKHPIGHFEYSNANYDALGYLVSVVSGQSYEDYMTEHVLGPLQMAHTHLSDAEARHDGLAQGHYPFFGLPIAYDVPFARSSLPSSFVAASAEDLGHVLIAHLNDGAYQGTQVLDAASMADLRHPLTHPDPWDGYGWGWWSSPLWNAGSLTDGPQISQYQVPVMLEHTGSHATFASGMVLLPEEGFGVVVLMNMNDEVASSRFYELHTGIAQMLLGRDAPPLVAYDDLLAQNGRLIALAWVLAMSLLVAWSVRRYRRWGRDPASAPRGAWAVARKLILPLLINLGLLAGFWLLVASRGEISFGVIVRIIRLWPDIGLLVLLVTAIGVGWSVVGTIWAARVARGARPHSTA